jgi:uncharacterized membrane protein YgdD (TMEM256/DUF423 family)
MERRLVLIGAILGGLGVAAGAFGAHGLKKIVSPEDLAIFETGVRYHLVHALSTIVAAWACGRFPGRAASLAGWLFVVGVAIFSGTLYAMTLGAPRWLGAVTPVGGTALIGGWIALAVAAWRGRGRAST